MTKLAIIIISFNTKQLTLDCLKSVYANVIDQMDVIVVDNNSTDGSAEAIKKDFPKAKLIINSENLGFAKANNQGIKSVKAQYYLLLNSDTIIQKNALKELVEFADQQNYGVASCQLFYKDGSFQGNGGSLPTPLTTLAWLSGLDDIGRKFFHLQAYHQLNKDEYRPDLGWVGGTAMLIKSEVVEKIGLLDEKIFMYAEDVDYCWRARRAGFKVGWTDSAKIIHLGGASSQSPHYAQWRGEFRSLIYLYKKYYGNGMAFLLRLAIYKFTVLRIISFSLLGRWSHAQTYAKILTSL